MLETLEQRDAQREDDDQRQHPHEVADPPLQQHHRGKREHGRRDRREHRVGHFFRTLRRRQLRFEPLLDLGVDVLADDDRIVHQHAQHHDEAEHRNQVQRDPGCVHDRQRPEDGDDEAHHNPERNAQFRKNSSDKKTNRAPQNPLRTNRSRRPSMNRAKLLWVFSVPTAAGVRGEPAP